MKNLFTYLFLFSFICSHAQEVSQNMSLLTQWNPDSLPTTSDGKKYNDVWGYVDCQGNEYALIGGAGGVHIINITDPDNVEEIASFDGGQITLWRDIKTYRDRAYAISDATTEGLMIFDLGGLPGNAIKTYHENEYFGSAHNIFIDEGHGRLYVCGAASANLLVFDIRENPDQPELVASLNFNAGYIHDLYVRDHIAYANHLSQGLYIYNLSDVTNPVTLGSLTSYPGEVFNHSCWLSEDGMQLVFCDEKKGATVKILDVGDHSDLEVNPSNEFYSNLLDTVGINSIAHNPLIRDHYAIVSYYHDGIQIFDISDPDNVVRVAYYDTDLVNETYSGFWGSWGVYPFLPSGNILASDMYNGLFVLRTDNIEFDPVNPVLAIDPVIEVEGPFVPCEGDEVTLHAPGASESYQWYKDDVLLTDSTGSIVTSENGNYKVVLQNQYCESVSEDIAVLFTEIPDLTTMPSGEFFPCKGDVIILEAPDGIDSYMWMKDGNVLANTTSFIQIVENGSYRLFANNGGCSSISEAYVVQFVELPPSAINADQTTICHDGIATLSVGAGAEEYHWYFNNELFGVSDENTLATSEEGIYYVEMFLEQCSRFSDTIQIEKQDEFIPSITASNDVLLAGTGVAFQWYLDGAILPNATAQSITATENGLYFVIVENEQGCFGTSEEILVTVTSLSNPLAGQIHIYPNPVQTKLWVETNLDSTGDVKITITDIYGKEMLYHNYYTNGNTLIHLDLPELATGIYFVQLFHQSNKLTTKIVKQ